MDDDHCVKTDKMLDSQHEDSHLQFSESALSTDSPVSDLMEVNSIEKEHSFQMTKSEAPTTESEMKDLKENFLKEYKIDECVTKERDCPIFMPKDIIPSEIKMEIERRQREIEIRQRDLLKRKHFEDVKNKRLEKKIKKQSRQKAKMTDVPFDAPKQEGSQNNLQSIKSQKNRKKNKKLKKSGDCLLPVSPQYLDNIGKRVWMTPEKRNEHFMSPCSALAQPLNPLSLVKLPVDRCWNFAYSCNKGNLQIQRILNPCLLKYSSVHSTKTEISPQNPPTDLEIFVNHQCPTQNLQQQVLKVSIKDPIYFQNMIKSFASRKRNQNKLLFQSPLAALIDIFRGVFTSQEGSQHVVECKFSSFSGHKLLASEELSETAEAKLDQFPQTFSTDIRQYRKRYILNKDIEDPGTIKAKLTQPFNSKENNELDFHAGISQNDSSSDSDVSSMNDWDIDTSYKDANNDTSHIRNVTTGVSLQRRKMVSEASWSPLNEDIIPQHWDDYLYSSDEEEDNTNSAIKYDDTPVISTSKPCITMLGNESGGKIVSYPQEVVNNFDKVHNNNTEEIQQTKVTVYDLGNDNLQSIWDLDTSELHSDKVMFKNDTGIVSPDHIISSSDATLGNAYNSESFQNVASACKYPLTSMSSGKLDILPQDQICAAKDWLLTQNPLSNFLPLDAQLAPDSKFNAVIPPTLSSNYLTFDVQPTPDSKLGALIPPMLNSNFGMPAASNSLAPDQNLNMLELTLQLQQQQLFLMLCDLQAIIMLLASAKKSCVTIKDVLIGAKSVQISDADFLKNSLPSENELSFEQIKAILDRYFPENAKQLYPRPENTSANLTNQGTCDQNTFPSEQYETDKQMYQNEMSETKMKNILDKLPLLEAGAWKLCRTRELKTTHSCQQNPVYELGDMNSGKCLNSEQLNKALKKQLPVPVEENWTEGINTDLSSHNLESRKTLDTRKNRRCYLNLAVNKSRQSDQDCKQLPLKSSTSKKPIKPYAVARALFSDLRKEAAIQEEISSNFYFQLPPSSQRPILRVSKKLPKLAADFKDI